jgi:hypothetical protein
MVRMGTAVFGFGILMALGCGVSTASRGGAFGDESYDQASLERNPVRLRYAVARGGGCSSCRFWSGVIEIANLDFSKDVAVVWKREPDGVWVENQAQFLRTVDQRRELWSFSGVGGPGATRFAIRYRIRGAEYWDNNGGSDYSVTIDASGGQGLVGFNAPLSNELDLAVTRATVSSAGQNRPGNVLNLELLVRNRVPSKQVSLVFTLDNWQSTQTVSAQYVYGGSQTTETWSAGVSFGAWPKIEFAVVSRQANRESWDNNFGRNYECRQVNGRFECTGLALLRD